MSSYDLETRRLLCRERVEQLSRDMQRPVVSGRRRRRRLQIVLSNLIPRVSRSRRPSLGS
jgi:hypothetical protein